MITLVSLLRTAAQTSTPEGDEAPYNPSTQMAFDWPSIVSLGGGHTMTESTGGQRRSYDNDADDDD